MGKSSKLFVYCTIFFSLSTALLHSLSFLKKMEPANDTEASMIQLMTTYKQNMGFGFDPTMMDIFLSLSACMTMLCFFAGMTTLILWKTKVSAYTFKHYFALLTVVFCIGFLIMLKLTFLPPIVCFGLIFVSSLASFLSIKA